MLFILCVFLRTESQSEHSLSVLRANLVELLNLISRKVLIYMCLTGCFFGNYSNF